jgi:hypothetical protein
MLLALAQSPASAGDAPAAPVPHVALPLSAVTATDASGSVEIRAPGFRVEDLLRTQINPADVLSLADATRAIIETRGGVELPDLRPEHSAGAGDTPALWPQAEPEEESQSGNAPVEEEASGIASYPSPAGDLTGDGLADIAVFEVDTTNDTLALRAVRGTNGQALWGVDLDNSVDAIAYPVGDATGDGRGDLLMHTLAVTSQSEEEDCEPDADHCRRSNEAGFEWTVGLRSGKDGKLLWMKRYPGALSYQYSVEFSEEPLVTAERFDESFASTNLQVLPYDSGDHDGDGVGDLVIQALDLAWSTTEQEETTATLIEQSTGEVELRSATRAEIVSGPEGSIILTRVAEPGPRIALLEPIANVVGGPAPDLLWEESITPDDAYSCTSIAGEVEQCSDERALSFSLALEAIDGGTLESGWRTTIDDLADGFSWRLGEDLSGDGAEDILVFARTKLERPFILRLFSGRDGAQLWERPQAAGATSWEFPLVTDDLGDGSNADLVLGTYLPPAADPFGVPDRARFSRVNGATGFTLFATERAFSQLSGQHEQTFTYLYLAGLGDADGDHMDDAVAGSVMVGFDRAPGSDELTITDVVSTAVVDSGRTDSVIFGNSEGRLFTLSAAGDLQGDGTSEAFEFHNPLDPTKDYSLTALHLASASALWSRSFAEEEYWTGTLWPGGDHDGDGGEDIVYGRNEVTDHGRKSLVASLAGATGAERWRREK